mgnify:CR=1 FL=1
MLPEHRIHLFVFTMRSKVVSCIWCGKNVRMHLTIRVESWRNISSKRYRWIHKLIEQCGTELEMEMIICGKCRIGLYKARKRGVVAGGYESLLDEQERNVNFSEGNNSICDSLIGLKGFYGDGNDEYYCS